jgi:hypothetical protein
MNTVKSINNSTAKKTVKFHKESSGEVEESVHLIMSIEDYTRTEMNQCWWDASELERIKKEARQMVRLYISTFKDPKSLNIKMRGLERFKDQCERSVTIMFAREAILNDYCVENYGTYSAIALKEARKRAEIDGIAVDIDNETKKNRETVVSPPNKKTKRSNGNSVSKNNKIKKSNKSTGESSTVKRVLYLPFSVSSARA